MITKQLPKIGFLGIMHGLYDVNQPELPLEQEAWAREVVKQLEDVAVIDFPGAAKDRGLIEKYVKYFNDMEYDGIMVVNLLYGPGMRVVQAFKDNRLPVLIANIQPLPTVTQDWDWKKCTTNQGIHGIQDTSNMLMRLGIKPEIITDDWKSDNFSHFFSDWALAAATAASMKKMRVSIIEKMQGMGDILGDEVAFYRVFGIEVNYDGLGEVYKCFETVTEAEIDVYVAIDKQNFAIDKSLSEESHRYAAQLQLAFEKFCDKFHYDGFTANFNVFREDGRIRQLPILGASNMLAKGYGYSAEGDIHILACTLLGHLISENPHFTEMYSLDYERDATMLSHMGEGNWKVARKDRPIKLIDRPLDIGDRDNPPTPVFSGEPGEATIISLVAIEGDKYRMVSSLGTVLDTAEIPGMLMNYTFFKPYTGVRASMDGWLRNGGTHHQVMFVGDQTRKIRMLCKILKIEFVEV
ncbi:MAG: L-fucose/L-arabinose isomerase family protein [Eubacteriales bacterium]